MVSSALLSGCGLQVYNPFQSFAAQDGGEEEGSGSEFLALSASLSSIQVMVGETKRIEVQGGLAPYQFETISVTGGAGDDCDIPSTSQSYCDFLGTANGGLSLKVTDSLGDEVEIDLSVYFSTFVQTVDTTTSPGNEQIGDIELFGDYAYILGLDRSSGNAHWNLQKRNRSDGSLVWSQDLFPLGSSGEAPHLTSDATGIYISGSNSDLGILDLQWEIQKRSHEDASLLWSQTSNPSGDNDLPNDIDVDDTGIYIAGVDSIAGTLDYQWRIEKRNLEDGSSIWSRTINPSSSNDSLWSVSVYGSSIYLVGMDQLGGGNSQWRIEKRFANTGVMQWIQQVNPSANEDVAYGVAVDSTGVYIAGFDSVGGDRRWRIEKRALTNGSLVWSQAEDPGSATDDELRTISLSDDGIYVGGYTNGNRWSVSRRELDGNNDWSVFLGTTGTVTGSAVDSTGVYFVGYDFQPGTQQWRFEKRKLSTGTM